MALTDQDITVLQDIVALEGKCMDSNRCKACPFRSMCLPEFLNSNPPTSSQRSQLAMDVLTHHALVDSELSLDELSNDYRWSKK